MSEVIKPHSFDVAKKHIQTFSSKTSSGMGLEKVSDVGGLFGWFDHNVTGAELNKITSQILDYFIKFNQLNVDFIKEFGQVYNALESLDGEYIPAILSAVKGAEEASNQAKTANLDIKKSIEAQKQIIAVLEEHKKKLDKLKHLENIDELWNNTQCLRIDISTYKANFESAQKQLSRLEGSLKAIQQYADSLLDYEHLDDIDDIWSDVEECKVNIIEFQKTETNILAEVGALTNANSELIQFRTLLEGQHHLFEVDTMWNSLNYVGQEIDRLKSITADLRLDATTILEMQTFFIEFKNKLQEQKHLFDIDRLWSSTNSSITSLEINDNYTKNEIQNLFKIIEENKKTQITIVENLKMRIKTVSIIAGGALGFAIFELILLLTGKL